MFSCCLCFFAIALLLQLACRCCGTKFHCCIIVVTHSVQCLATAVVHSVLVAPLRSRAPVYYCAIVVALYFFVAPSRLHAQMIIAPMRSRVQVHCHTTRIAHSVYHCAIKVACCAHRRTTAVARTVYCRAVKVTRSSLLFCHQGYVLKSINTLSGIFLAS